MCWRRFFFFKSQELILLLLSALLFYSLKKSKPLCSYEPLNETRQHSGFSYKLALLNYKKKNHITLPQISFSNPFDINVDFLPAINIPQSLFCSCFDLSNRSRMPESHHPPHTSLKRLLSFFCGLNPPSANSLSCPFMEWLLSMPVMPPNTFS